WRRPTRGGRPRARRPPGAARRRGRGRWPRRPAGATSGPGREPGPAPRRAARGSTGRRGRLSCGEVARPVRLEEVPLVGGPPDEDLEVRGQGLGDPGDVLLDRPLAGRVEGRPHDADVAVAGEEV